MGKTAIALTLLHHYQIADKFGKHRHFVPCDAIENSLDGLLERLSHAIGVHHCEDAAQLRSHLQGSPCILVLDDVDSILDPRAPEAAEIATAIEEFGRCPTVCLLTTTRMEIKIQDFVRMEVPTLQVEAARDAFHSCCHLGRSVAVDDLLVELDFHPLSITLLASAVSENNWDEPTLLEAWDNGKTSILKASGHQSLEERIQSILRAPTIRELGTTVQETLEGIAAFPGDVKEIQLLNIFPQVNRIGDAVDALCKFSLMYRQDGFVKIFPPFWLYFRYPTRTQLPQPGSDTSYHSASEDIQHTPQGSSLSICFLSLQVSRLTLS